MAITPIPPNQPINGISQSQLADWWWIKVNKTPPEQNPINFQDSTEPRGRLGSIERAQSYNNDNIPVFFLVGTLDGTPVERTILLPNEPIFFPVVNIEATKDPGVSFEKASELVTQVIDSFDPTQKGKLFAKIANSATPQSFSTIVTPTTLFNAYRQGTITDFYNYTPPGSNTSIQAVQNGIYLGFQPNSFSGGEILKFGGDNIKSGAIAEFSQNNTYNILNPVLGTSGNDIRFGTLKNDFIEGGQGKDILVGTAGNDLILGGSGSDIINGGRGNDELWGDASLKLRGGNPASDIFVYNGGKDKIFDFQLGSDKIFVSPLLPKPTINPIPETVNTKSSTQITFGNNTDNTLTLIGLAPGQVTPDIFIHTSPHSSASIV